MVMAGAIEVLVNREREQRQGWEQREARRNMAAQETGDGNGRMISAKEYVDVKVEGVRSDLQAGLADLRAEVRGLAAKIEALPTTWTLVGTVAGGFAVSLSLLFTFLSYSNDNAEHVRARQMQLDRIAAIGEQTDRRLVDITARLDRTAALAEQNAKQISELSERMDRLVGAEEQKPQRR